MQRSDDALVWAVYGMLITIQEISGQRDQLIIRATVVERLRGQPVEVRC